MNSEFAARIHNIGKSYRIGASATSIHASYGMLSTQLVHWARNWRTTARTALQRRESAATFWALRDVSFDVRHGDVVGIVGRNGAGKSTLLKILSRITAPTRGRIDLYGRVGALLEVGTGFHAELTGRENVFLNGAILGMRQSEVARKFDEIVAFAEMDKFIDTAIKHYSSGMGMRLAFAVAAFLEPEILIVDEVLAVGDVAFQKKCIGKMSEVAGEGRTVLFVSHNMPTLLRLCNRGVLLENGQVTLDSDMQTVAQTYLQRGAQLSGERRFDLNDDDHAPADRHTDSEIALRYIRMTGVDGNPSGYIPWSDGVQVEIGYDVRHEVKGAGIMIRLYNGDGTVILTTFDYDADPELTYKTRTPGHYVMRGSISRDFLRPGGYTADVSALIVNRRYIQHVEQAISVEIVDDGGVFTALDNAHAGLIAPRITWETESAEIAHREEVPTRE